VSARLRTYLLLWRSAVGLAHGASAAVFLWGTAFLMAASMVFGLIVADARTALTWASALAPGGVLLVWAFHFTPTAVKMNTPANARLVPQARRRLMELTYLIWLACILVIALNPHKETAMVSYGLFWAATTTLGLALCTAGNQVGIGVILACSFGSVYMKFLPGWMNNAAATPAFLAAEVVVFAAVGAMVVRMMFPDGGDAHWKLNDRRKHVRPIDSAQNLAEGDKRNSASYFYARTLRRAIAKRDQSALVMHALSPGQHIGATVASMAMLLLVGWGAIALTRLYSDAAADAARGIVSFSGFTCAILAVTHAWRPTVLMRGTPAEQSLVRLAPAMPSTARGFNRRLAHALLRQALGVWVLAAACAMLLAWIGGASAAIATAQACVVLMALPAVALSLRDHARRVWLTGAGGFLLALLMLTSMGIAFVGAYFGVRAMPVVAGCALLLTAVAVLRGLRVMEAAPYAFPAGRLD
jgi:hypothetical protein